MTTQLRAVCLSGLVLLAPFARAAETPNYAGPEPDRFMTRWLVLAPLPIGDASAPDEPTQRQAFARDLLAGAGGEGAVEPVAGAKLTLAGKEFEWRLVESPRETVDLEGPKHEFALAYAWAEIESPEARRAVFAFGSDDALKVWVNGALVHEKWIARGVQRDEDLVGVELRKGRNRLLLKVQNMKGEWGFVCRPLSPATLTPRLLKAAQAGDVEASTLLLDLGTQVDGRGPGDLTAVQAARLAGRQAVVDLLVARGADASAPLPPRDAVLHARLLELFKPDGPGAAVLVSRDGQVLFERAYGRRDVEGKLAATPGTPFRIGSVTKQFTAAAILRLHEQGQLSLQDPLSKFIPDYPRGSEVTLHHLLTHTSGIHSFTSSPDFMAHVTEDGDVTPERHIATFKKDPYDFAPGARWSYSNSGYFLLGYIVQKVSGQSYDAYLRKTFFEPLGMRDTGFHVRSKRIKDEALGYAYTGDQVTRAPDWNMSKAGGAGALYSTVGDLHRWNEAVFSGKVLGEPSLKAAFSPALTADEDPAKPKSAGYGYGWSIQKLRGMREISHGGGLPGFMSYLMRLPESRFTVAVLLNAAPAAPGIEAGVLAREIAELYLGETLPVRAVPKLDPSVSQAELEAVVGDYDLTGATLTVTREGARVFVQPPGQARSEIFPSSATSFFAKERDRQIDFVKNASGQVIRAEVTNQAGQTVAGPRKAAEAPAKVDSRVYDDYVGRYDYGGAILTVSREGDKLMAQLSGQPAFEIFPRSEATFFWKVVTAEVTFVRNEQGVVAKALHKQGGQTIDAPRVPELQEVQVDPTTYDAYVGRYDYGQAVMTVTREGDRLWAQLAGQPKFEIFPKAAGTFFWKVVNAEITFVKDAAGYVTKGIHRQAGQTIEVPRLK